MGESKLNVGGIALCGGQSRRMGTSKARLDFGGETFLQRIVRLLGEVVYPIVVVAAEGQELPSLPEDVLLVHDTVPGLGPLQGLADGLAALEDRANAVFVSSCDTPLLRPAFVAMMIALLADKEICVVRAEERFHPLAAVYRWRVLATVRKLLAENRRRPTFLFDELPTRVVAAEELVGVDPELHSLRNLNTPEEYRAALQNFEKDRFTS